MLRGFIGEEAPFVVDRRTRRRARWKVLFYVDEAPDIARPIRRIFESGSLDPLVGHRDVTVLVQRSQPGKRRPTIRYVLGERPRSLGEVAQMRAATLRGFLEWQKAFPAERTLLVVLGHGDGWEGVLWNEEERRWMTLPTFAAALDRARVTVDLLDVDACHLSGLELVEFEGIADFAVASQLFIPAESQDYAALSRTLADDPRIAPVDLGRAIVTHYAAAYSPGGRLAAGVGRQPLSFTLLRLSRAPEIVYHLGVLGLALRDREGGIPARKLRERLSRCDELGRWRDLVEFLQVVVTSFARRSPHVARRAARVIDLLRPHEEGFVVDFRSVNPKPYLHGVLVELGTSGRNAVLEQPDYERLRFEKLTDWRGYLHPIRRGLRREKPRA
jgi:cysteine peptidase C11 family protein